MGPDTNLLSPGAGTLRGFSAVELLVGVAAAAALVAMAVPGLNTPGERVARADGAQALMRLQVAQERHHSGLGFYAQELTALRMEAQSPQGRYHIQLAARGPDAYTATATAQGKQASDRACAQLTLEVVRGFATTGPDGRCWNR